MKPTTILALALPLLAIANPITPSTPADDSNLNPLAKRDKTCFVTEENSNCREGAGTGYDRVRRIQPNQSFDVRCKAYGENIEGNKTWDWIPGWKCWVHSSLTSWGCESEFDRGEY
ncbi:hypothetical protein QBC34DRAFT_387841 [Podospora aff. communis PSN243]|uniref:Uncharacterized protein n=1 Tax=Podospora aff. communis PSN243 TaxID=3040156 RepID=A0AAV9G3T4_9PEZI|nr:hypothetical protein QBC34DRAFT_387841 [Podospora aff. communis PSN243]